MSSAAGTVAAGADAVGDRLGTVKDSAGEATSGARNTVADAIESAAERLRT